VNPAVQGKFFFVYWIGDFLRRRHETLPSEIIFAFFVSDARFSSIEENL
jgi:hypothetical protein